MEKIKVILIKFWEDTKVMAKANPKKAAFLIIAATVIGFSLGRCTG